MELSVTHIVKPGGHWYLGGDKSEEDAIPAHAAHAFSFFFTLTAADGEIHL